MSGGNVWIPYGDHGINGADEDCTLYDVLRVG